jgi:ABC-type sugar transport system substrate-binding protein
MKLHVCALMLAATGALVGTSGCLAAAAGAAAGVGTYAYIQGDLDTTVQASFEDTWQAANQAASDLGLRVTERAKDEFAGRLVASQVEGGDVKIQIDPAGEEATRIRIRVGTFGDERKSLAILDRIRANL